MIAWTLYWVFPSATSLDHMKNFVRLVQFAWPLQGSVRALRSPARRWWPCSSSPSSVPVYPLLHILFDSQNPQRWISEKIDRPSKPTSMSSTAGRPKLAFVRRIAQRGQATRRGNSRHDISTLNRRLREKERGTATTADARRPGRARPSEPISKGRTSWLGSRTCAAITASPRRGSKELGDCGLFLKNGDSTALDPPSARHPTAKSRQAEADGIGVRIGTALCQSIFAE